MELGRSLVIGFWAMFGVLAANIVWLIFLIKRGDRKFDIFEYPQAYGYVAQKEMHGLFPRILITAETDDEEYYHGVINNYFIYYVVKEGDWLVFDMAIYKDRETGDILDVAMSNFRRA